MYTEGIEVKCKDEDLNAKLYNNRASAHYASSSSANLYFAAFARNLILNLASLG